MDFVVIVAGDFQVVEGISPCCWIRILTTDLGTGGSHMPAAKNTHLTMRSCFDNFS